MAASVTPTLRFQPLFELGRGGVAVVRAERMLDEHGENRLVAVKRLLPLVAESNETRSMFLAEARLAALIDHPNVVRILAEGSDGEPFIAMELVRGENLALLVARARERGEAPLSPALALHLAVQLCDALHAAHELRDPDTGELLHLVHRDVSPQNVLVGFDGTIKLSDFGIAKALGYGARTRTGDVKGKVPYMSPEQAIGDEVDRRSDLFALGAVLFECIGGRRMLGEGNEVDMLRKLAMESLPSLGEVWPDAPAEVSEVFARLIAREPTGRFSSAAEAGKALRGVLSALPAHPDTRTVAARMAELAPRARAALEDRLAEASREAERQQPYLEEIERFVDRPSELFRERRRARAMMVAGVLFFGATVVFAVAILRARPTPTRDPGTSAFAAAASSTPVQVLATTEPTAGGSSSAPAIEASSPKASSAAPPARSVRRANRSPGARDGLDENPF